MKKAGLFSVRYSVSLNCLTLIEVAEGVRGFPKFLLCPCLGKGALSPAAPEQSYVA